MLAGNIKAQPIACCNRLAKFLKNNFGAPWPMKKKNELHYELYGSSAGAGWRMQKNMQRQRFYV